MVEKRPGSSHYSPIFRSSALGRSLEEDVHNTEDSLLLGDSGYALRSYLMTPYIDPVLPWQKIFNGPTRRHDAWLNVLLAFG